MTTPMKALSLLFFLASAACGGAPEATADAPDEQVKTTIVAVLPDGSVSRREIHQSRAEVDAEIAAREAAQEVGSAAASGDVGGRPQAIGRDAGCSDSSLWLWDQAGQRGNRLCLSGIGTANLATYYWGRLCSPWTDFCTGPIYWDHMVQSYWTGSSPATFSGGTGLNTTGVWTRVDNPSQNVRTSSHVYLWW